MNPDIRKEQEPKYFGMIARDMLAGAGYEVRHGKNTFSKIA